MPGESILMIDDEKEIHDLVEMYAVRERFSFHKANNGKEALNKIKQRIPDIILLDISLPDADGVELCRQIRQLTFAPIIFVTGKDSELDKVIGFSAGGDDYIPKPFSPIELIARIKAHLRRGKILLSQNNHSTQTNHVLLKSKSITLNLKSHEVYLYGKEISLSSKEFQLLSFLMEHSQQVFSPDHLLERIWGFQSTIDHKTVIVHIGNLRKKLKDPSNPKEVIYTVRGAGYKFNEKVHAE